MVYLINDTVDIYCFAKIDMKKRKNTHFKAASGFFEANREVPAFFFRNCRKLLYVKTLTPLGKDSWAKPDSLGSENM